MHNSNYYKRDSHNVFCDVCGKKRKRESVRKTWQGYMACIDKGCYDPKHPNEKPRKIIPDALPVANARDRNVSYITPPSYTKVTDMVLFVDPDIRFDDDKSQGGIKIGATRIEY